MHNNINMYNLLTCKLVVLVEARITTAIRIYLLGAIKIHASPFNS